MLKLILKVTLFAVAAASLLPAQSGKVNSVPPASFSGKWEVGLGVGAASFYITLEKGGKATKSTGSPHGTWTVYEDEARISWDDGWHDVIRKAGTHYEKVAFAPGKSFSDKPDNIEPARRTEPM